MRGPSFHPSNEALLNAIEGELVAMLPRLRRLARALARHTADGDDLVQLAIERALARRDQWTAGTRLDFWVMRIMKNGSHIA